MVDYQYSYGMVMGMDEQVFKNLSRSAQEQYLLRNEIIKGKFGASGEPFMTTKKLAELRMVSVVTAHNIMSELCNAGYLELRGKKYYLSYNNVINKMADRSKVIGLILPSMNNEFYSSLSNSLTKLALQKGYRILTMTTAYSAEEERKIHDLFADFSLAGIISCVPAAEENIRLYQKCTIPYVMLSHSINALKHSSVQVNSFTISQKVAEHLISEGYQEFIYIGCKNISIEKDVRYTGFRMGLIQNGYSLPEQNIIQVDSENPEDVRQLTQLLQQKQAPIGVFCYHDLIAATLYGVCYKLHKNIPAEIGIVGFDDLPIATVLQPTLTTVHYRMTTMAEIALKQLFLQMEMDNVPYDNFFVEPTLVVRESSSLREAAADEDSPSKEAPQSAYDCNFAEPV